MAKKLTFYEKLLKVANGESMYSISKATGISQQTISGWKANDYKPGVDSLQKLSKHFGVDISYFLDD